MERLTYLWLVCLTVSAGSTARAAQYTLTTLATFNGANGSNNEGLIGQPASATV